MRILMLVGRNIIIKKDGDKCLLPTFERKEAMISGLFSRTYMLCRIVSYNEEIGVLSLKQYHDVVSDLHYNVSTEVNSEILSVLDIKKVVFTELPASFSNESTYRKTVYQKKTLESDDYFSNQFELNAGYNKPSAQTPSVFSLDIQIPVKDLKILDGKLSFEYFVKHINRKVIFEIANEFLKKEFDSIKNYFAKVLNSEKFNISIQYEFMNGNISNETCTSPQVTLINQSLFEKVEELFIEKNIIESTRQEIVSITDLALESAEITGSNKISDPEWLLQKLINPSRTKHYYNLRYLSDKHLSSMFNLHLTGKPLSFIFLLKKLSGYCLVWETYSTDEATYVWKIIALDAKQLEIEVKEIVERIKWLRHNNKKSYLRTKPENFIKIEHDYSAEDLGFKKWRGHLNTFISGDSV